MIKYKRNCDDEMKINLGYFDYLFLHQLSKICKAGVEIVKVFSVINQFLYCRNSHCEYWIYPEHPDANISLDFHFVDMEYHVNCDFDYIMVNGGKKL